MCTYRRREILANDNMHEAMTLFFKSGFANGIAVGRYVIMPDHVHLFVRGAIGFQLGRWVQALKSAISKMLIKSGEKPPFWQRGFFDHIMRNSESYEEKWDYVRVNPVRKGYVSKPDDWPYSGEIVKIDRV